MEISENDAKILEKWNRSPEIQRRYNYDLVRYISDQMEKVWNENPSIRNQFGGDRESFFAYQKEAFRRERGLRVPDIR